MSIPFRVVCPSHVCHGKEGNIAQCGTRLTAARVSLPGKPNHGSFHLRDLHS